MAYIRQTSLNTSQITYSNQHLSPWKTVANMIATSNCLKPTAI